MRKQWKKLLLEFLLWTAVWSILYMFVAPAKTKLAGFVMGAIMSLFWVISNFYTEKFVINGVKRLKGWFADDERRIQ